MSNKFDNTTRLMTALYDETVARFGGELEQLAGEADRIAKDNADAKAVRDDKAEAAGGVWGLLRTLAQGVEESEMSKELDAGQISSVLRALIGEAVKKNETAAKSVKSYVSTATNVIKAVREKRLNWHQTQIKLVKSANDGPMVEAVVSYADIRDMLRSDGQKAVDSLRKEAVDMLTAIAGKESDVRAARTREDTLREILELLRPYHTAAAHAKDTNKKTSAAARAVNTAMAEDKTVTEAAPAEAIRTGT